MKFVSLLIEDDDYPAFKNNVEKAKNEKQMHFTHGTSEYHIEYGKTIVALVDAALKNKATKNK
jgi:hypothetical protein